MLPFTINHMSAPRLGWRGLLDLAKATGCIGVEFRNDLGKPLFDGDTPETVAATLRDMGLRMVGLSQVYPFNDYSDAIAAEVQTLINTAQACGAESISLIPKNDGTGRGNGERQANLRLALREILPMLQAANMVALVEPLGFQRSSLRHKEEAINAIEGVGGNAHYKIVHDTFHHHLASEEVYFPEHTGIIHISGVVDPTLSVGEMEDEHRVLVDQNDRLRNIEQIRALLDLGYRGPISMESFSPVIHAMDDVMPAMIQSFEFIRGSLLAKAS